MALWTPAEIATAVWQRPEDSATVTLQTGIKQLADKSGNSRHAIQNTTGKQPALTTGGLNSQDIATFDNVDDSLVIADAAGLQFGTGDFAVLCVAQLTNASKGSTDQNTIISKNYTGFELYNYQGTLACWLGGTQNSPATFPISSNVAFMGGFTRLSGSLRLRLNGTLGSAVTNTANVSNVGTALYLGSRVDGAGNFLYGSIAELIILPAGFTIDEYELCEGYLAWDWGLVSALRTDHPYKSAAPTIPDLVIRAILNQPYSILGDLVTAILDQTYHITNRQLATLIQVYGLRMLQILAQHYGDLPAMRQMLEQYWGPAAMLRRLIAQPYGDALRLRQGLDQEWGLNAGLLAIMEQRYSISSSSYLAMAEQVYNLNEYTILKQQLDQIYLMSPDAEEAQEPLFSITTNDGNILKPHHINIEIDEGEYAIKGEIHFASQEDFILCKHLETEIIIPIDSTEYHLIVEGPRQSRPEWGKVEYYIPLASKTILLDNPYSTPIEQEFTGALASAIVIDLAAIKSITVIWQLIDWYIPTGVLTANNESPLSIIRRIVNSVGGILQSSPAGELICLPEYPISTTGWETAVPDFYLTDMDNFFSVDSTSDIREGYNRFLISDQAIDESGLTLEQVDIDEETKDIYVYQVPWNPLERVILHTSGGVWVSIVAEGIITEEKTEIVEIIAGEGMTQKPFYGFVIEEGKGPYDYKETNLGIVTIDENKAVSTVIKQNSLVEVVYNTKYWKFRVRDAEIEKVQFFPEAIPI